jgi:flap endonuclease-1
MGIKGFSDLIKSVPCTYDLNLSHFKNTAVAIDMGDLLYSSMSVAVKIASKNPETIEDQSYTWSKCIQMIIDRIELLLSSSITPVCVFDTEAHPLKSYGLNKRKAAKEKIAIKLSEARENNNYAMYSKYIRQNVSVSCEFSDYVKLILTRMGITTYTSGEFPFDDLETKDAEGVCALLCRNNLCTAAITPDTDFHVYGGNIAIIDIKGSSIKIRVLDDILKGLNLDFNRFRDLCILCGTDYNSNIPGIGPVRALEFIRKFGSMPEIGKVMDISVINYPQVIRIYDSTNIIMTFSLPNVKIDVFESNLIWLEEVQGVDKITNLRKVVSNCVLVLECD